MQIETARLTIRPARLSDAEEVQVAKEAVWPELQKWMSWAYDEQYPIGPLRDFITNAPTPHTFMLAFDKQDNSFAIATGLIAEDELGVYTTGYWAAPQHLGKGYALEATHALIRYAFTALKAKCILISHYEGNDKSARIIKKLGFMPIGMIPGGHKRCSDGTPLNVYKFAMTDANDLPPLDR